MWSAPAKPLRPRSRESRAFPRLHFPRVPAAAPPPRPRAHKPHASRSRAEGQGRRASRAVRSASDARMKSDVEKSCRTLENAFPHWSDARADRGAIAVNGFPLRKRFPRCTFPQRRAPMLKNQVWTLENVPASRRSRRERIATRRKPAKRTKNAAPVNHGKRRFVSMRETPDCSTLFLGLPLRIVKRGFHRLATKPVHFQPFFFNVFFETCLFLDFFQI